MTKSCSVLLETSTAVRDSWCKLQKHRKKTEVADMSQTHESEGIRVLGYLAIDHGVGP
jgi:hypothetical protein